MSSRVSGARMIRGEGRVTLVKTKFAVLSKPGLDGGVILVPSSIIGQQYGYPDMHSLVSINDILRFEALGQEDKNGIKWQALDGTVELVRKAEEVEFKGSGLVSFIDDRQGQFGFIESQRGSVWFNANVVRPETRDIARVLKKGQSVDFVAIENPNSKNQCRYRATLVHSKGYKRPEAAVGKARREAKTNLGRTESYSCAGSEGSGESSRPSTPATNLLLRSVPQPPPPRTQPLDIILSGASEPSFAGVVTSLGSGVNDAESGVGAGKAGLCLATEEVGAGLLEYFAPGPKVLAAEDSALAEKWRSRPEESSEETESLGGGGGYSSQLEFLQRIAHRLLGIASRHDCPVCSALPEHR